MNILGPIHSASSVDHDRARADSDTSPSDLAAPGFAALLPFGPGTPQAAVGLPANAASWASGARGALALPDRVSAEPPGGKPLPDGPPPPGRGLPHGSLPQGALTSPHTQIRALSSDIESGDSISRPDRSATPSALVGQAETSTETTQPAGRAVGAGDILASAVANVRAAPVISHPDSIASRREMAFERPPHSSATAQGGAGPGASVSQLASSLSPLIQPSPNGSAMSLRDSEAGAPSPSASNLPSAERAAMGDSAVLASEESNGGAARSVGAASLRIAESEALPRASTPIDAALAKEGEAQKSARLPHDIDERAQLPSAPRYAGASEGGETHARALEVGPSLSTSAGVTGASAANPTQTQASNSPQPGVPNDLMRGERIEGMIDQLAHQRESARSLRGSMTVTHAEFGAIAIRIEGPSNDLRAHLSNRDPAFAPAVHHALETRAATSAGDASLTSARHGEAGQNGSPGSQQSSSQGAWTQANNQSGGENRQDAHHRTPSQDDPLGQERRADFGRSGNAASPRATKGDGAIFA